VTDNNIKKSNEKTVNLEFLPDYAKNTIIVLWSDHGYHLGEKNRFAKASLWERDTRIPLIFKIPGNKSNIRCSAPVQLIDIYPTLVDLCGLEPYQLAEGHSLVPLISNPEMYWPHEAISVHGEGNVAEKGNLTCDRNWYSDPCPFKWSGSRTGEDDCRRDCTDCYRSSRDSPDGRLQSC
jgi:arylsulfatase A-like enzyme